MIDLEALKALAQAATPGPWRATRDSTGSSPRFVDAADGTRACAASVPDAAYIAAASPDAILALIARLEAAERVVDVTQGGDATWHLLADALAAHEAARVKRKGTTMHDGALTAEERAAALVLFGSGPVWRAWLVVPAVGDVALDVMACDSSLAVDATRTAIADAIRAAEAAAYARGVAEAVTSEREAFVLFLGDRREQYLPSDRMQAFIDELQAGVNEGRHRECFEAGEYDDMRAARLRALGKQ